MDNSKIVGVENDVKTEESVGIIKILKKLVLIGVGFFVLVFLLSCVWIGTGVEKQCKMAKEKYRGDCVEVLSQTLDDESNSFEVRNRAIWALGQIGDPRALVVLEQYKTDQEPQREPLDEVISQYELVKAINLASGDLNISKLIWGLFVSK